MVYHRLQVQDTCIVITLQGVGRYCFKKNPHIVLTLIKNDSMPPILSDPSNKIQLAVTIIYVELGFCYLKIPVCNLPPPYSPKVNSAL